MYRDSQYGLTIDLSGPDGNAFFLMGQAETYAKQLGKDPKKIIEKMQSGDYENLVAVFKKEFPVVRLINGSEDDE